MGLGESVKNAFKFEEDKKPAGGETGREGTAGTVTEGDPAMGGKYTSAYNTGSAPAGQASQGGGALDVQSGDPSMGVWHSF